MGSLIVPQSGLVYLDANPVIFSVERHPVYWPLLEPLWQEAKRGSIALVSSELVLIEVLVGPFKTGDATLANDYELLFSQPQTRLFPITQQTLRTAARLRATTKLKTPDAIHAATAQDRGCVLFVTNDSDFRAVSSPAVVILDDLLTP